MKLRIAMFALIAFAPLQAQEPVPPPAEPAAPEGVVIGTGEDRSQRMTVPVTVEGSGPYAFIVDTGAERTAIAQELASDLQLGPGRKARLHSMSEVSQVRTVLIPALGVGGKSVLDINAPALERRHIGAEGILGVDTLQNQRVSFDFAKQQMTVSASRKREEKWPDDTIVITARNRFGHLVLVDAEVDGQKVWVILDTGAQISLANNALRRKLERKKRLGPTWRIGMVSVTGGRIVADQALVSKIRLGDMDIHDLPLAFADVHPFRKLDLMDRPALLLGMDALKLFERVSVDFANRRVKLFTPQRSERAGTVMVKAEDADPKG
jgi:predicted aspartyl protease